MQNLLDKRVVLIAGKGGVGRSTMTAALAQVAARAGKTVLVTELGDGGEDYSALAQLFGINQLPRQAAQISPGIFGSQLLPSHGVELFLAHVLRVPLLARTAVGFEPLRRLLAAAPSFRELGIFYHLLSYLQAEAPRGTPRYNLVLLDMPATGHALALTGLPEVILRLVSRGPMADALREGQSFLNDPARAGAYIVTLPEKLPITEALELLEGLEKNKVPVGGLLINRMPEDPFDDAEREALATFLNGQRAYGADGFTRILEARKLMKRLAAETRVPVIKVPELDKSGLELVGLLAELLAGQRFQAEPA